jgi:hypothetical protein
VLVAQAARVVPAVPAAARPRRVLAATAVMRAQAGLAVTVWPARQASIPMAAPVVMAAPRGLRAWVERVRSQAPTALLPTAATAVTAARAARVALATPALLAPRLVKMEKPARSAAAVAWGVTPVRLAVQAAGPGQLLLGQSLQRLAADFVDSLRALLACAAAVAHLALGAARGRFNLGLGEIARRAGLSGAFERGVLLAHDPRLRGSLCAASLHARYQGIALVP